MEDPRVKFFNVLALVTLFSFSADAYALNWKGMFIAGDDSIANFDNGRIDLTEMFSRAGNLTGTVQLSSSRQFIGQRGVLAADGKGIASAFQNLKAMPGEGCFIHMTSHGGKGQGFYFSLAGMMSPQYLASAVEHACGSRPTVILISACYSGQFIVEPLKSPNRIILTAARPDRPSFGCSADTRYTYWDGCLLSELPKVRNWKDLYENVRACISKKESAMGMNPSEPQAFFGAQLGGETEILQ